MTRRAVVLMNLGGPDSLEAVRPFLYNLFSDKAIIRLPAPLRLPLAALIASRRAPTAREIYAQLGGSSPLLANTQAQAQALENELGHDEPDAVYRCFVAMRYWHPLTPATVSDVKQWSPDEIVLLPLYPQFSTTTTQSSLAAWERAATRRRLDVPTRSVRSYPEASGFIAALAASTRAALDAAHADVTRADPPAVRLLLSAHGLPEKIVKTGDPYPREVATTAAALLRALAWPGIDPVVCYQSRVGPLAWIGPSVEEELRRAACDRVGVVVVPVSFVSEHSETLVELDREYRRFAEQIGVPFYHRVPTVGTDSRFVTALADMVRGVAAQPGAARAISA